MFERTDVVIPAEGGIALAAWLYLPEGPGPHPAISMAHGFAGTRGHGLERFANAFADAGFAVLLHDHRSWGHSEGEPRQDTDPWRQIADWRRAISFLEAHPAIDANRIGLWGTSYAGGHAIVLGATDRRLKAVVAQVPTISGFQQSLRRVPPEAQPILEEAFDDDERAQFRGESPRYQAIVGADASTPAAYRTQEAIDFYKQPLPPGVWDNKVTFRASRWARMYEPGQWIDRVSPTPLLLVVGRDDKITPADLALAAFERALEPKKLAVIPGGHFDLYTGRFAASSAAAIAWFTEHLDPKDFT